MRSTLQVFTPSSAPNKFFWLVDDRRIELAAREDRVASERLAEFSALPEVVEAREARLPTLVHPPTDVPRCVGFSFGPTPTMSFVSVDWAIQDVVKKSERLSALCPVSFGEMSIMNLLCVSEGQISARRSQKVSVQKGVWTTSTGEGGEFEDFAGGVFHMRPAVQRGLTEELDFDAADRDMRIVSIGLTLQGGACNVHIYPAIDARDVSLEQVLAGSSNAVDAWEWDELALVSDLVGLPESSFSTSFFGLTESPF